MYISVEAQEKKAVCCVLCVCEREAVLCSGCCLLSAVKLLGLKLLVCEALSY